MTARTLMIQGTASGVGKSVLTLALCRLFARSGLRVAPFKAVNMSLNAAATPGGLEIGRAQAAQAEAAGVPARVEMNPILLKPEGGGRCQVVLLGRPLLDAGGFQANRARAEAAISESLARLRAEHDLVVIEGAGSPAEPNLRDRDLANMHAARLADAPVVLVGDIDRGGVFAALVGTLALLPPEDRARVRAFLVNKFRGERAPLAPALRFLEERTGVPVAGVIPHLRDLGIAEEDAVSLEDRPAARAGADEIEIAVLRLPGLSNFDDFQPLEAEPGAVLRYALRPEEAEGADLLVLPGSKSTLRDLARLRAAGWEEAIRRRVREGRPVLGVCGGCQMLGETIEDPERLESPEPKVEGLGLLPLRTRFGREKTVARVRLRPAAPTFLTERAGPEETLEGYEIHLGAVRRAGGAPAFRVLSRGGEAADETDDGAVSESGAVVGTMVHGLFENAALRASLLGFLRRRRGLAEAPVAARDREAAYDRLADHVAAHADLALLRRIAGLP